MEKEFTEVYCGSGKGKTTLAVGQCLRASANGKSVIIIQFHDKSELAEQMELLNDELTSPTASFIETFVGISSSNFIS